MAATNEFLTVLEVCRVSPPPDTVGERSLPLTFFDLGWLLFHPIHQLFFYEFPYPTNHFIQTIIPNLKSSLSITLQHFFPFASNLIVFPASKSKPEIRYVEGDSVTLTFAECTLLDFNDLIGNHPRDCNKFYPLVPGLEGASKVAYYVKIPIFSIQVTIFPNSGITIGFTNHHSLCDARTRHDFLSAWTSIAKYGTDELFLANGSLPFYDRVIKYPSFLDEMLLSIPQIQTIDENYQVPRLVHQTDRVRATFVLTRSQINRLKKWLLVQLPSLQFVSSFVVVCAFTWSCIARSRLHVKGTKGEYELERFGCVIDWRTRMDPPVPQTYFGNCGGIAIAQTKTTQLTRNKGFSNAAELLQKAISEALKNKKELFKDAETWLERASAQFPTISVAGTPKLNVYAVDFGWGKPKKYETISIDFGDSISVNVSKDSPEDLEIGLALPAEQMDAFIAMSRNELESIVSQQE